jgi:hypothetical protein
VLSLRPGPRCPSHTVRRVQSFWEDVYKHPRDGNRNINIHIHIHIHLQATSTHLSTGGTHPIGLPQETALVHSTQNARPAEPPVTYQPTFLSQTYVPFPHAAGRVAR